VLSYTLITQRKGKGLDTIRDLVLKALRTHLEPAIISDVRVFQEADSDGDPILRLQVVVDSSGPKLSSDKVFFATGVVRNALATIGDSRFPLLSFPTSKEISGEAA
jgi:hypothetical protein